MFELLRTLMMCLQRYEKIGKIKHPPSKTFLNKKIISKSVHRIKIIAKFAHVKTRDILSINFN